MAVPTVTFTEEGRNKVAKAVGLIHWISIIPAVLCLIIALYIQLVVEDKILFLENYNGAVLPAFLVFTGFFSLFGHILCGKAFWANHKPEKREKWAKFLIPAVIVTLLIFLFEIISGILCFVHVGELEDSLASGITTAMKAYKNDMTTKEEMDLLQIEYECCGSRSYQDWFKISWVHPDFMSASQKNQKKHGNDDVPFSCCTPHVLRPCIYHHVHDNDAHYNYDYRVKTTLYKNGCADKLMEFYEDTLLSNGGAIIMGLSFIQLIVGIVGRLLQTAVVTSMASDDEQGDSVGYLFGAVEGEKDSYLDTTTETETTGDQPLLETTFDSTEDALPEPVEPAYISMEGLDQESEEPMYENTRPDKGDEEPIYHDEEVEQYLLDKYNRSKEYFEHLSDEPSPTGNRRRSDTADTYQNLPMNQSSMGSGVYDEPLPYPPDELESWRGVERTSDRSPSKKSLRLNSSSYVRYNPEPGTHVAGNTPRSNESIVPRSQHADMDTFYGRSDVPRAVHYQSHVNNSSIKSNNEYMNRSQGRKTSTGKDSRISCSPEVRKMSTSRMDGLKHTVSDPRSYHSISDASKPSNPRLSRTNQQTYTSTIPRSSSNNAKHVSRTFVPFKVRRNDTSKNAIKCIHEPYGIADEFNRQYDTYNQTLTEPLITNKGKPLHQRKRYDSVGKASVNMQVQNLRKTKAPLFNSIKQDKVSEKEKTDTQRRLEFTDFQSNGRKSTNIKKGYVRYGGYENGYGIPVEHRASANSVRKAVNESTTTKSSHTPLIESRMDADSNFYQSYQTYDSTPNIQSQYATVKERYFNALSSSSKSMHDNAKKEALTEASMNDNLKHTNTQFDDSRGPADDFYIDSFASLIQEAANKSSENKHTRTHSVSPIYPVTSPRLILPRKRNQTENNELVINLVPQSTPHTSPMRKCTDRRAEETTNFSN